jgi:hypothetical protein
MKQGKTLQELARELSIQELAKKDYVVDTRSMKFTTTEDNTSRLAIPLAQNTSINKGATSLVVNELTHRQIADRINIPFKYYERMRQENQPLLDTNVNSWFQTKPERRMIRTLDNTARAFLSDCYRRIDNFQLAEAVLPVLAKMNGAEVVSSELTETRMYIKVINKSLELEIKKGDVVQAGIVISNSEVGLGSVRIEPLIYRLVCSNGLIAQDFSQRKYHVGRIVETDGAYELFRDETLQADDTAFFLKVQDLVRAAVDKAKFSLIVERMRQTSTQVIQNSPIKAVDVLSQKLQFSQTEKDSVLKHLINGKDLSGYGLVNAVTHTSKEIADYDRATEFERFGGILLALPKNEWQSIVAVA